jgi:hypothetical protein
MDCMVSARDLKYGKYSVLIDGHLCQKMSYTKWPDSAGVAKPILSGPSLDQVETLRKLIIQKNRLYFNRWRPQNETYLFGFRKEEQGQNAKEIPEFDPLVEKLEKEIARLRKPIPHTYQLVPVEEDKK